MSVSRMKTIAIVALVLVNAFFLAIGIFDTYADAQQERQAIENVCSILQSGGIEIDPDSVTGVGGLKTMRTARGVDLEEAIATALLGQVEKTDQAVIYIYENTERGTATFYSGGDFVIELYEGAVTDSRGAQKTVQTLLRNMKLAASIASLSSTASVSSLPESEVITAVNTYKGYSILNCTIDFVFSGGSLRTVRGRYVSGIEPADDGVLISNVETALLRFLVAVESGDVVCTRITDIEAGYYHSVVGSFGGIISPIWLITTESGQYVLDSATGEIRLN